MSNFGNRQTFSKNLKHYMKLHNKSRKDVCKDLGFSYSTFTDWINGKKYPRIDKIEMLSIYFGIEKSDLIEEKTSSDLMTIGNLFEYLRKQRKLSIAEFAEETGLTEENIKSYEKGKGGIPADIVKTLANYFDISAGKLTAGKVKNKDIFAAFASTNEAYVEQVTKWVEVFGDERFSNDEFEKIIDYAKFILSQRKK